MLQKFIYCLLQISCLGLEQNRSSGLGNNLDCSEWVAVKKLSTHPARLAPLRLYITNLGARTDWTFRKATSVKINRECMEDFLKGQPRASSKSVFLSLRPRAFHACLYSVRLPVASPRQSCVHVFARAVSWHSLVKIIVLFHSFPGVIDVDRFSHAIVRRDRGSAHADPGTGQYVHLAVLLCSDVWMRSRSQELWYVLVARHDPIWCWRAPLNHQRKFRGRNFRVTDF